MHRRKATESSKGGAGSQVCEFIIKILEMMKNHPQFVRWSDDGLKIKFVRLDGFKTEVLPKFFRHCNMMSFVRQLNMYYFTKASQDEKDEMTFQHSIFRRGNEHRFKEITRRNRIRDEVIVGAAETYKQTLETIEKEKKINDELKNLMTCGIQYTEIVDKFAKKVKGLLEELIQLNTTARCKEIKLTISNIRDKQTIDLQTIGSKVKSMQLFIKKSLCRDIREMVLPDQNEFMPPIISDDHLGTCKDLPLMSYRSRNSLIPEGNMSFKDDFDDKEGIENDPEASIEEDLESYQKICKK